MPESSKVDGHFVIKCLNVETGMSTEYYATGYEIEFDIDHIIDKLIYRTEPKPAPKMEPAINVDYPIGDDAVVIRGDTYTTTVRSDMPDDWFWQIFDTDPAQGE